MSFSIREQSANIPGMRVSTFTVIAALLPAVFSHSVMTVPFPMSGSECRIGGPKKFLMNCPGPCDISKFTGDKAEFPSTKFYPPNNPAATYSRGEKVRISYARNNHPVGGFNRFSLVRYTNQTGPESEKDYMDKSIHDRNAFSYSCWGATTKVAADDEVEKYKNDTKYGLGLLGTDGREHDQAPGYYTTEIVIPPVVPSGYYVLGWAWYGGTGGKVTTNEPQVPSKSSHFGDYYTCSFIKIEGGVPLAASYVPVFSNAEYAFDKSDEDAQGWENGCMAATDKLGPCREEPCNGLIGTYRKPAPFVDGPPPALTPANFGGSVSDATAPAEPETPESETPAESEEAAVDDEFTALVDGKMKAWRSCRCLYSGSKCTSDYASTTYGCKGGIFRSTQPDECKQACCAVCKPSLHEYCRMAHENFCI